MVVRRSGALAALGEEEFSIIVLCSKGLTLEDSLSDERERDRESSHYFAVGFSFLMGAIVGVMVA